jgi:hypothetical protein
MRREQLCDVEPKAFQRFRATPVAVRIRRKMNLANVM